MSHLLFLFIGRGAISATLIRYWGSLLIIVVIKEFKEFRVFNVQWHQ